MIFVRYHKSAFVMLLRLIGSILLVLPVVWILEQLGLRRFEKSGVLYIVLGLWLCAELIYRGRHDADEEIQREELAKSTGVDPEIVDFERQATAELRRLKDGTPIHEKSEEDDDHEFD
jgi:hypothetical protein